MYWLVSSSLSYTNRSRFAWSRSKFGSCWLGLAGETDFIFWGMNLGSSVSLVSSECSALISYLFEVMLPCLMFTNTTLFVWNALRCSCGYWTSWSLTTVILAVFFMFCTYCFMGFKGRLDTSLHLLSLKTRRPSISELPPHTVSIKTYFFFSTA